MKKSLISLAAALLLVACAGPSSGGGGASSRCSPTSAALIDAISSGLTITGGGSITNGQTVKSGDFEKAYFVSANLNGEGLDGTEVATWVTNDVSGAGSIYAVDSFAKEFSDWGDGSQTDAAFSLGDDGAQESRACAGG